MHLNTLIYVQDYTFQEISLSDEKLLKWHFATCVRLSKTRKAQKDKGSYGFLSELSPV
jgi:hypothetical protein